MAEIKDVTLQTANGSNSEKLSVTVKFKLLFKPPELGKTFSYGIALHGATPPGDDEPSLFNPTPLLFAFTFGVFPGVKNFKTITAQTLEQSFTETREVEVEKLNEDPGVDIIKINVPPTVIKNPHFDEVFAAVRLSVAEANSNIVTLLI